MERAKAHADAEVPSWSARARGFLERFIREEGSARFIAFDVRTWAERQGLPPPPKNCAWGSVFRRASVDRIVVKDGFEQFGDGASNMHTRPVQVWRTP
jgi:hypothetical protein